jgi:hypothetical protein
VLVGLLEPSRGGGSESLISGVAVLDGPLPVFARLKSMNAVADDWVAEQMLS